MPADPSSLAARVRAIVPIAARLDRARAKLAELPSNEKAKAAFDEATRRAQVQPTAENLDRVTEAVKELQRQQPKRVKLETDYAEAERALGLALQDLVRAAKGAAA